MRRPDAEIVEELLDSWDVLVSTGALENAPLRYSGRRQRTVPQVQLVFGYAMHVHELARLLLPHLQELSVVHVPTIRAIFEATTTLAWCHEIDDAPAALTLEMQRQSRASVGTLNREGIETSIDVTDPDLDSSSTDQVRWVERMAEDLDLPGLYIAYRGLSRYAHASPLVAGKYSRDGRIQPRPPVTSDELIQRITPWCLVWAGGAVGQLAPTGDRQHQLRRIATETNIPPLLTVTKQARERVERHRRAAQRAARG